MSNNRINLKLNTQLGNTINVLKNTTKSLNSLSSATNKASGDFRKFFKNTRKIDNTFSNLARDANRARDSFGKLGGSLLSLDKIISGIGIYKLSKFLSDAIVSSFDMIETTHLFEVAMGELAEETDKTIQSMHKLTGLDVGNLRDRIGNFSLLAQTMGITAKNAQTLGVSANNLILDLGALFNIPYAQVAQDIRSGLIGQSRTMYKYGIDVTEAAIAQEALNQGITKSVRHMTQGEKMALRYSVMIKQASMMHGDFAETINSPMNQLRILRERFATLSRTIGSLFIPIMERVLPVINAVTIALIRLFRFIGGIFGIKMDKKVKNTTNAIGGMGDSAKDAFDNVSKGAGKGNKGLKKATKRAKELKKQLAGFDELNIIQTKPPKTPDSSSGAGGGAGGGGLGDGFGAFDLDLEGYDAKLDSIAQKADEIADKITEYFKRMAKVADPSIDAFKRLWNEGLSLLGQFTWDNLKSFYNNFLVPVGTWTLSEGLKRLFDITNALLKEINWDKLLNHLDRFYTNLAKLTIISYTSVLDFYERFLKPIGVWTMNEAIPRLLDIFSRMTENINWDKLLNSLSELWDTLSKFTINILDGILTFIEDVVEPLATWVIDKALPVFLDLVAGALDVLNPILEESIPLFSWLINKILKPLSGAIGWVVVKIFEAIAGALKRIGKVLDENRTLVKYIIGVLGTLIGLGIVGKLSTLTGTIGKSAVAVNLLGGLLSGGKGLLGIFGQLVGRIPLVGGAFKLMGSIIGKGVGVVFKTLPSLIGSGFGLVKNFMWKGVTTGIPAIFGKITSLLSTSIIPLFTKLGGFITTGLKSIGVLIKGFVLSPAFVPALIVALIALLVTLLIKNWDKVMSTLKSLVGKVKDVFSKAGQFFTNKVLNPVKEIFVNLGKAIKEQITKAWNNIVDVFKKTQTWWSTNVWKPIQTLFSDIYKWIQNKIRDAWNFIVNTFNKTRSWFSTNVLTPIRNVFTDGYNSIRTTMSNAWNRITSIFGNVHSWFGNKFTSAWNRIKGAFSGVNSFFSGIWRNITNIFNRIGVTVATGISNSFKYTINAVIRFADRILNGFIRNINRAIGVINKIPGVNISRLPTVSIPKLADGGVVSAGQMFIAREAGAELVGNFGGKTAVMNNDDIVRSVTRGVYGAVRDALGHSGNNNQPLKVVVKIGSDTVVEEVISNANRQSRINGETVIIV